MTTDHYYSTLATMGGFPCERRLRHQMSFLYKDVDFRGKTVLDIGGGTGLHSLYASAKGARSATIIEPESDGGHSQMIETFHALQKALGASNVELIQTNFQDFHSAAVCFDIVLIQNAINHFDEPACISLRRSPESRAIYDQIFKSIASLIKPGGLLLLSDASSRNLFPTLRLKNPFDPGIEWHKHQPPSVWKRVASRNGLQMIDLRWSSPGFLGKAGQALFGNALMAWFFTSHFLGTFRKVQA